MLKGLVINSPDIDEKNIKKVRDTFCRRISFDILDRDDSEMHIIDARDIDMIFVPHSKMQADDMIEQVEAFVEGIRESERNIIALRINNNIRFIDKKKILFIEVLGRNSYLYTAKNKYILSRQTLNQVIDSINDKYITRCHKSYAVNVRNIEDILKEHRGLWKVAFKTPAENECLISSTYYEDVLKKLAVWIENNND